jgi:hypothetical protein
MCRLESTLSKGFRLNPSDKFLNVGMFFQFLDGVEFSFQLLLGEQGVKLIVTGTADGFFGIPLDSGSLTFNFFVMPHSRNQMMPGGFHILSFA